jgi:methylglyoxal synthase
MGEYKRIALVAHNNKKFELIECLRKHRDVLTKHNRGGIGERFFRTEPDLTEKISNRIELNQSKFLKSSNRTESNRVKIFNNLTNVLNYQF